MHVCWMELGGGVDDEEGVHCGQRNELTAVTTSLSLQEGGRRAEGGKFRGELGRTLTDS